VEELRVGEEDIDVAHRAVLWSLGHNLDLTLDAGGGLQDGDPSYISTINKKHTWTII